MFKSNHYVPILKWKRAEQNALKMLDPKYMGNITPMIQLVMPKPNKNVLEKDQFDDAIYKFEEQRLEIPEKIQEIWGKTPIFIDFSLLYTTALKVESILYIIREGYNIGANFIPVVYLSDDNEIKEAIKELARENDNGFCLKLIRSDFSDIAKLNKNISEFLKFIKVNEKYVDLMIDINIIDDDSNDYRSYLNHSRKISNISGWRTFTFASGSFPRDLTKFKFGEDHVIPRLEWNNWKNLKEEKLERKPAFSDYTIQHPIYYPQTQFYSPSSSIRYTSGDKWIIMKGKQQSTELYLANAKLLAENEYFYGEDFSYGDKYIYEKGMLYDSKDPRVKKTTGSPETWLMAGINHHLTLVANQISNLHD